MSTLGVEQLFLFVFSAVPLFLMGAYIAWSSLPSFVVVLIGFTPEGSSNVINASEYILFAIRIVLVFGLAFVIEVVTICAAAAVVDSIVDIVVVARCYCIAHMMQTVGVN